jgi:biopolymer transport protein ExbD
MKFQKKPFHEPEINLASLVDIAFLLLIFFILTTTFTKTAGNKLSIPSGSTDSSKKQEKQITVSLKPGEIHFGENSQIISLDAFRQALAKENFLGKDQSQRIVILDSDKSVAYDEYFQVVMAIAKANGVVALMDQDVEAGKTGGDQQ